MVSKKSEPGVEAGTQTGGEIDERPPPILGRWENLYAAVIVVTLAVYGFLFWFSSFAR